LKLNIFDKLIIGVCIFSYLFDNPDLITFSMMIPLNNMRIILTFPLTYINIFSEIGPEIKGIAFTHEISRYQFPKLINSFIRMSAYNPGIVILSRDLYSLIVSRTENSILVPTRMLKIEFLIWGVLPFVQNQMVVIVLVLGHVQNHLVGQPAHKSVADSWLRGP